jgi:hypothetical protein
MWHFVTVTKRGLHAGSSATAARSVSMTSREHGIVISETLADYEGALAGARRRTSPNIVEWR